MPPSLILEPVTTESYLGFFDSAFFDGDFFDVGTAGGGAGTRVLECTTLDNVLEYVSP